VIFAAKPFSKASRLSAFSIFALSLSVDNGTPDLADRPSSRLVMLS
jgi:hypothetical protein